MTASERIELLAPVVAGFPEMGAFGDPEALRELVREEWREGLMPPKVILHIISSNTAMAGMQSLVRGLILGSRNLCKTPSSGLSRFEEMVELLPESLRQLVEVSSVLPEKWLTEADAVIVFGNDSTVEKFRNSLRPDQIFAGYGNRWSGTVIFSDADFESIDPLIRDVCLYEQMGCLSTQIIWLNSSIDAVEYGNRLAAGLARYVAENPPSSLTLEDAASVARWRSAAEWLAVADPQNHVWLSSGQPVWGVVLSEKVVLSCLHRHVSLAIFADLPVSGALRDSVSSLGVWPFDLAWRFENLGASRICQVGEMQFPQPTWQQDGHPALGRLLRKNAVV